MDNNAYAGGVIARCARELKLAAARLPIGTGPGAPVTPNPLPGQHTTAYQPGPDVDESVAQRKSFAPTTTPVTVAAGPGAQPPPAATGTLSTALTPARQEGHPRKRVTPTPPIALTLNQRT